MRAPVGRTDEPSRPTCAGPGRTPGARLHLRLPACARTVWRATFGSGQILLLLTAWAVAQWPFIVYPHIDLHAAAAPADTLTFVLATLPLGDGTGVAVNVAVVRGLPKSH